MDAWNGYHSVALAPESKNLTTFITPWGRYRYITMPQGYLAAGDAYTERFNRIVAGVKNKTKCIDDSLLWSDDIEEAFYETCRYLSLCSQNGIVMNPKKFMFCQKTVEYAGFEIGDGSVKPATKTIEAIRDYLVPKTISDMRGWFGMVNQISPF